MQKLLAMFNVAGKVNKIELMWKYHFVEAESRGMTAAASARAVASAIRTEEESESTPLM